MSEDDPQYLTPQEDEPEETTEISAGISEDAPEDVSEYAPEDIPDDVSEDVPDDASGDVSEDASDEASESAPGDASAVQRFAVPPKLHGQRADKVLALACPQFSRERLQESFAAGAVFVEGQPRALAKKSRVQEGDVLLFTPPKPLVTAVHPVAMPLEILYEDDDLVAVNKPVGLVVHPGAGVADAATLVHGMLHHCGGRLAMAGGAERPGIVHRLDRDTSGIIVLAKTDAAYYALVKSFAERHTRKIYWALVRRAPAEDSGTVKLPIGRHPTARHKMAVREDGRYAHTDWRVLERFAGGHALVECHIHTGRTHQIRVHLSQMGSPIWGDKTYGFRPLAADRNVPEQFLLYARELELPHPVSGLPLALRAEPSAHFAEHLGRLRTG